jgi:hypothetical protein
MKKNFVQMVISQIINLLKFLLTMKLKLIISCFTALQISASVILRTLKY